MEKIQFNKNIGMIFWDNIKSGFVRFIKKNDKMSKTREN